MADFLERCPSCNFLLPDLYTTVKINSFSAVDDDVIRAQLGPENQETGWEFLQAAKASYEMRLFLRSLRHHVGSNVSWRYLMPFTRHEQFCGHFNVDRYSELTVTLEDPADQDPPHPLFESGEVGLRFYFLNRYGPLDVTPMAYFARMTLSEPLPSPHL